MSTLDVIVIAAVALLVLLALGGMAANARWRRRTESDFESSLDEVNRRLAAAHAQDKGWEPGALRAAARQAFAQQRPGEEIRDEALVAVIDQPGTDQDQAVFRFATESGTWRLTLGRRDGEWFAVGVDAAG